MQAQPLPGATGFFYTAGNELGSGTQAQDGEPPQPWTAPGSRAVSPSPRGRRHQRLPNIKNSVWDPPIGTSLRTWHFAGSLGSSPLGWLSQLHTEASMQARLGLKGIKRSSALPQRIIVRRNALRT